MAGKVLVSTREHIDRLVAARLQADVLCASTLLIARTDAEAATLLDCDIDERDQPFILGTCHSQLLSLNEAVQQAQNVGMSPDQLADVALQWEVSAQLCPLSQAVQDAILALPFPRQAAVQAAWDSRVSCPSTSGSLHAVRDWARQWLGEAQLQWDCEKPRTREGYYRVQGGLQAWSAQPRTPPRSRTHTLYSLTLLSCTRLPPDSFSVSPCCLLVCRVCVLLSISRAVSYSPYADVLWMETKAPVLEDAAAFANAVHAAYPHALLAYNLSPSFNWTSMGDDAIRSLQTQLSRLGFCWCAASLCAALASRLKRLSELTCASLLRVSLCVSLSMRRQFVTLAGFHLDALATSTFARAFAAEHMLAYVRDIQRQEMQQRTVTLTHQQWSGAELVDTAVRAITGGTSSTQAMGNGNTERQFTHAHAQTHTAQEAHEQQQQQHRQPAVAAHYTRARL